MWGCLFLRSPPLSFSFSRSFCFLLLYSRHHCREQLDNLYSRILTWDSDVTDVCLLSDWFPSITSHRFIFNPAGPLLWQTYHPIAITFLWSSFTVTWILTLSPHGDLVNNLVSAVHDPPCEAGPLSLHPSIQSWKKITSINSKRAWAGNHDTK